MKLKKFFAGVLAAAMMLTVGATAAFATTATTDTTATPVTNSFGKTFTKNDKLVLTKNYKVEEGIAPAEEFEFTIDYVGAQRIDTNVSQPTVNGLKKYAEFEAVKDSTGLPVNTYKENFEINLSELGISENGTGIYVYKITETDKGTPGVTYDVDKTTDGDLYMVVTVSHDVDENGVITTPYSYNYSVALRRTKTSPTQANGFEVKGTKVSNEKAFNNTYGSSDKVNHLTLTKTVKGGFGDLNETFTFTITLSPESGKSYGGAMITVSDTTNEQNGKVWAIDGNAKTITLKHGQTVTISNLPVNAKYTITENGVDQEGWIYKTTGEVKTATAINADKNEVTIINEHQGVPDMGVVLDNAPYIAMLAIVAIGGVALMLNKRRRDEE